MAVFPKEMDKMGEDTQRNISVLDAYIRYMAERVEFTMGGLGRSISGAGMTSAELAIGLNDLRNSVGALASAVGQLTGEVNSVKSGVGELSTAVAGLENTVGELSATVTELGQRVTALEERSES